MKKIFRLSLIIFCSIPAISLYAQNKNKFTLNINYNYALPVGSFRSQAVSDGTPRGASGDFIYRISKNFSAGFGVGFQDFYQKYQRALYKTGTDETTSAVLSNSIQVVPVILKGYCYPLGAKKSLVQPYISAGTGLAISSFTQYWGEFSGSDNTACFALQGGAGTFIAFSKSNRGGLSNGFRGGLSIGADYNMIRYNKYDINNFNNLSFKAGVYIPLQQ